MEVWKPVPGFNCEASSLGRIRVNGVVRKPYKRVRNYLGLRIGGKMRLVSRLVAFAFHGLPPSNKPECMHLDDNPQNNAPSNLRWGSRSENMAMDVGNNHAHKRSKNPRAKVSEDVANEIRNRYLNRTHRWWGMAETAKQFNISPVQCSRIARGVNWK